jgi:hypothetical protein
MPTDFNFTAIGIFFKVNKILYRQGEKIKLKEVQSGSDNNKEEGQAGVSVKFNHALHLFGCKLLIIYNIRPVLKNLFFEPI